MRTSRLATVCVALLAATLVSGAALAKDAKRPAPPKNLHGFLLKPNEPTTTRLPAHARVLVGTRARRALLRVRARHEPRLPEQLRRSGRTSQDDADRRRPASPSRPTRRRRPPAPPQIRPPDLPAPPPRRRRAPTAPAMIPPLTRAGRLGRRRRCRGSPGSRTRSTHASVPSRRRARPRWSSAFGFNMRWPSAPAPLKAAARARALDARRGRDRLSGLVPADRQVVLDEHERRRPARLLHLPPRRPALVVDGQVARPRGAPRLRDDRRTVCPSVSYGQWSPIYIAANPALGTGKLRAHRGGLRPVVARATKRDGARAHARRSTFTGDQGSRRSAVRALPRLRRDRP